MRETKKLTFSIKNNRFAFVTMMTDAGLDCVLSAGEEWGWGNRPRFFSFFSFFRAVEVSKR